MTIKIEVPDYTKERGINYYWVDGFKITVKSDNKNVVILANKEGLVSLANHFLNLSQSAIPSSYHMHFDEYNSLEEGSSELIIEKE